LSPAQFARGQSKKFRHAGHQRLAIMPSRSPKSPAWICSQIGAREHFAIPRALHQGGRLAALYTDFWAGPATRKLAAGKLRPLAARFHPDLAGQSSLVHSWNLRSLGWELLRRRKFAGRPYHDFIEFGRRFATNVREDLKRRPDLNHDAIFYAYDTGALESLTWCREQKIKCVLNQMDPNRVEVDLVRAEEKNWPGWTTRNLEVPEAYFARREQEWSLADRIVVNSEFSRQALLRQGVTAEKLAILPLCFEAGEATCKSEIANRKSGAPLRVLFLGQVILRKGIQYLLAAARQLERENIHFDVVGPLGISETALKAAPGNVTFHGRTSRDQAATWYRQADVFVLPTLSDGFALTQLEAMAHGLPVIATPCCGEVVTDGVDGFIVPPRDAGALTQALQRHLAQPELLSAQSAAAREKSRQFTLDRLAENLAHLEASLQS
jgi:glycosyltransferase involved in cell wall biosynthesis